METYGFFNAEEQADGTYDREYFAQEFAYYFALFVGNGVFFPSSGKLQVSQNSAQNMSIDITSGDAFINGYWYNNNTTLTIPVENASPTLNRIDSVVIEWNLTTRDIKAKIVKGKEAAEAKIPDLQRDDSVFQLRLAHISVTQGLTGITNAQITDDRLDKSVCGIVAGLIEQVDTTTLYQQFESWYEQFITKAASDLDTWTQQEQQDFKSWRQNEETTFEEWRTQNESAFQSWFEDINSKLGTEPATSLQKQIDDMNNVVEVELTLEGWTGDSAPWSQRVAVPNLKETDNISLAPAIDKNTGLEQTKLIKKLAAMIDAGETEDGYATFYCNVKKPTDTFKIRLKGVTKGV